MNFKEIERQFKEEKKPIKLPSWEGYWKWENDTIMMYNKDKKIMDIRKTDEVGYTLDNICSNMWIVATKDNCPLLGGNIQLTFADATKYAERGCYMRRASWSNGQYVYVETLKRGLSEEKKFMVHDGIRHEYKASYEDASAHDWCFHK